ncbi:MAG: SRPBCC family protein [Candidatus Dormibacteria bacterium]
MQTQPAHRRVILERSFNASIEDVWELWTTTDGFEAWWGPEGYEVKVQRMDLRPGGRLNYVMTATAPDQVDFMKKAGMPVSTDAHMTFNEVDPPRRLAYSHLVDFIPGVAPYEVAVDVTLADRADGVHMTLVIDAMHDAHWTEMAVQGWEMQLGKLSRLIAERSRTSG